MWIRICCVPDSVLLVRGCYCTTYFQQPSWAVPIFEREKLKDGGNCHHPRLPCAVTILPSPPCLSLLWAHTCVTGTLLLTPPESSPVEAAQARWAREGLSQTVHPRSPCSAGLAGESWKSLNIWILNSVHFLHLVVKSSAKKNYQRKIKHPIKWGYTCWVWAPSI